MRDQPYLQASLLDRLIDRDPATAREPVQNRAPTLSQIRKSVMRDLENLLNTRRSIQEVPDAHTHVGTSLFTYGLGDFTSFNTRSPSVRIHIRQEIERTISLFEPRLKNLSVRFDVPGENERTLRFRVTALLVVTPLSEPVAFDTYLDINRGEYFIPT
ncbi:MAG: type VI secretion system baseplate subunit TssE [Geobacteraceae bacterium]|nr:type VI secretion system baseplate subunit TssE [Geobacteraceae bacterium]